MNERKEGIERINEYMERINESMNGKDEWKYKWKGWMNKLME